ncbi:hypothetical protein [Streptomyces sp. NPDC059909]|uniref:hypothetical protein n=1 Tax=Streptomyces sp. NPDC059909 TaxID=3346998 RepID=UPI0036654B0B
MRTRFRCAALVLPLTLSLAACGAAEEEEPAEPAGKAGSPEVTRSSEPAEAAPESPEDFLDLAERAMAEEGAWTFSVKGQEGLTLQGRKSAATYRATVRRGMEPEALHSQGVSTSSKGTTKNEEIYVVDGTAYLKEGGSWKDAPASDPEMQNKIEDPVGVIEEFRAYARAATGDDVTLTRADGTIELRVAGDKQKLTAVRDRAWVKKAVREFDPTADQLREAGIPVNDGQLTLSGLEEVLVLDAKTYRIRSHRFEFGFLVPYGGQGITFEQKVLQENQGTFSGKIELPADAR